jgi:hypothetical protein
MFWKRKEEKSKFTGAALPPVPARHEYEVMIDLLKNAENLSNIAGVDIEHRALEDLVYYIRLYQIKINKPKSKTEAIQPKDVDIIRNAIMTPDGTVLSSRHVHDYVGHTDKNGQYYAVDGGRCYLKRIGPQDYTELSVNSNAPFEVIRENLEWGTRGKDGKELVRYVKLSQMSNEHIENILENFGERISETYRNSFRNELLYRRTNNIVIQD